jgi:hypothetical protein
MVPVPTKLPPRVVQSKDPLRPSSQVITPVPPEIDFISKVPEQVDPLLETTVNGAPVLIPASPVPVNVSEPSDTCPVTDKLAEQAVVSSRTEEKTIHFTDFLCIYPVPFHCSIMSPDPIWYVSDSSAEEL